MSHNWQKVQLEEYVDEAIGIHNIKRAETKSILQGYTLQGL